MTLKTEKADDILHLGGRMKGHIVLISANLMCSKGTLWIYLSLWCTVQGLLMKDNLEDMLKILSGLYLVIYDSVCIS